MRNIIILAVCLFTIPASLPAQGVKQLEVRLSALEKDNQNLKEQLSKLQEHHKELQETVKEYEPLLENWKSFLGLFGIGTLAGVLGFAWLYFKKTPDAVNAACDNRIKSLFTDRREQFMALLKEFDAEQQAKQKHKLVMLTHRNGSDSYHFDLLNRHGFQVSLFTCLDKLGEATFKPEDVLIINNEGGHWQPEEVQAFVHQFSNHCFYVGKGIIHTHGDASSRFSAANIRSQFIGNLINVLKYK